MEKICSSCQAFLGSGETFYCTEIHTNCGKYHKDCTALYQ